MKELACDFAAQTGSAPRSEQHQSFTDSNLLRDFPLTLQKRLRQTLSNCESEEISESREITTIDQITDDRRVVLLTQFFFPVSHSVRDKQGQFHFKCIRVNTSVSFIRL